MNYFYLLNYFYFCYFVLNCLFIEIFFFTLHIFCQFDKEYLDFSVIAPIFSYPLCFLPFLKSRGIYYLCLPYKLLLFIY